MILAYHPDIPNRDTGLKFIGYWRGHEMPKRWGGFKLKAIPELPDPQAHVDPTWLEFEREVIIAYLKNGQPWEHWFGASWCRFECGAGRDEMGCSDFTDGIYVWPSGYVHYLADHSVKPPLEFVDHVLRR